MSNWGCLYLTLRANFDGMKWETRAIGLSYDREKGRVTVQHVDVSTGEEGSVSADTVIAADGVHSSVAKIMQTGHVELGKRLLNWVWCFVVPDGSPEMASIFTDVNGRVHPYTVPQGLVSPKLRADQVARYQSQMIAALTEVVFKTPRPFVTNVGDTQVRQASFFDDRLVLQIDRVWRGEITQKQRDQEATIYAEKFVLMNRLIGLRGLGDVAAVLRVLWGLILLLIKHKLSGASHHSSYISMQFSYSCSD
ncbi:hypothetical protein K432DRAFT_420380 [Lepidopterella palustris CBS 459.81]|uniref:2,6-dihydroxypyridine 3-monooxygenase substrate binding domain-containing protein n=1 Tax=Lepidopterella palustris CBS 459.81 TaxID=1314670 RepID=A0A8E2DYV6_9PEZI|nr:hypothetical protein K432DRAFT_420380 [Lepidopterella palustris CBS 459.81]